MNGRPVDDIGPDAPGLYLRQFLGPKAAPLETLSTASELLVIGLGGWALLALWAPRVAVLLHFHLDMPLSDVALALGLSVPGVKTRINRALKRLRPAMGVAGVKVDG